MGWIHGGDGWDNECNIPPEKPVAVEVPAKVQAVFDQLMERIASGSLSNPFVTKSGSIKQEILIPDLKVRAVIEANVEATSFLPWAMNTPWPIPNESGYSKVEPNSPSRQYDLPPFWFFIPSQGTLRHGSYELQLSQYEEYLASHTDITP